MKTKTIFLIIIAIIILILVKNKQERIVIPKESIRIRIIPNSNEEIDINEKINIQKNVEKQLYLLLKNAKTIEEAREIINNNLDNLNLIIDDITNESHSIKFGQNYFPKKEYKGVIYDEGNYESLVITLGHGVGDNWWCVLFPPLCMIEENDTTKDVEYQFLVKELIDKYLTNKSF